MKVLILLASLFVGLTLAQSRAKKDIQVKVKHGLRFLDNQNWKNEIMERPEETNMLVMFHHQKCSVCRQGVTQISRLAHQEGAP